MGPVSVPSQKGGVERINRPESLATSSYDFRLAVCKSTPPHMVLRGAGCCKVI